MNHLIKWDGHSHTQFCPHGNGDRLELFLERAAALGFDRYTVTEHPPLPDKWISNEKLFQELAMEAMQLPAYFQHVEQCKREFEDRLDVRVGLELDYLPGADGYTIDLAEQWQDRLEDAVVSVHFMQGTGGMRCIDFTADDFREGLLDYYGTMEQVVEEYYNHVERAIELASRLPGSKRIGHINLIEKFNRSLPPIDERQIERRLTGLLPKLAASGVGVDVNMAGLRVATCGKPYVPQWFLHRCMEAGVECVYGSDSHRAEHVGAGWDQFVQAVQT